MREDGPVTAVRRDRVRFILDGEVRELSDVDPTLTVLGYLRQVERRCGTKEGCGEGDCGACTVVLGELHRGRVRLRAVNGCLLLLPMLDGKALFTVESLSRPGEPLHPVQQALVDRHASQCGFCTPGFAMSLFALYGIERAPSRQRIDEALAGNLCRCTGYRPIVDAARQALATGGDAVDELVSRLASQLRSVARTGTLELEHDGRRFFAPRTLEALAELVLRFPSAHLLAGGTDLGLLVTKQHRSLDTVIALAGVPELGELAERDGALEIGAAVTYSDLLAPLEARHPSVGALLRRIGSQQIRNLGTLGGNLANASPVGDALPALLALDARLLLRRGGDTRLLPVDQFFLGYRKTALRLGELIESIRLPAPPAGLAFRTYKVSKRADQDISAVCGAFAFLLEGDRVREVRIAFGGMAAVPIRARACEAALAGRPWTEETVEAAVRVLAEELTPLGDLRASARYRRLVAGNLLRKFQLETAPDAGPSLVAAGEEA